MKFSIALVAIFSIGIASAAAVPNPVQPLSPRATVGWNDPAKKADYEQKACDALHRAGSAGGTIMGGEHTSPSGGDQNPHITVQPDGTQGPKKTMHVYPNGDATRKNAKGKTISVITRLRMCWNENVLL